VLKNCVTNVSLKKSSVKNVILQIWKNFQLSGLGSYLRLYKIREKDLGDTKNPWEKSDENDCDVLSIPVWLPPTVHLPILHAFAMQLCQIYYFIDSIQSPPTVYDAQNLTTCLGDNATLPNVKIPVICT